MFAVCQRVGNKFAEKHKLLYLYSAIYIGYLGVNFRCKQSLHQENGFSKNLMVET